MLATWAGKSQFSYTGSVIAGTDIKYGTGNKISVSSNAYRDLLSHFKGMVIAVSASRSKYNDISLGGWLKANVTNTAIASYVAPILIQEGYATRTDDNKLRFNS